MPRPAPRVAPATSATRPASGPDEGLFLAIRGSSLLRVTEIEAEMLERSIGGSCELDPLRRARSFELQSVDADGPQRPRHPVDRRLGHEFGVAVEQRER